LLQHREPVKHQIERDMLAVAKAEHLNVVYIDRAARWWDVPRGTAENAVLRSGEFTLLDCDVVDDVNGLDVDARIREGGEPAAEDAAQAAFPSPCIPPDALKTTSSANTSANPSMSWALKVAVPFSKASRAVIVIGCSFGLCSSR
jgi:hypothetical protein